MYIVLFPCCLFLVIGIHLLQRRVDNPSGKEVCSPETFD